jgi:EAL domain-containing protein (putative c-di-GMP-specific phosphodiesterase class I)
VLLELVEEDREADAFQLLLELLVRLRDVAVEVALDDLGRALRRLPRVRELVALDLREARGEPRCL